MELGQDRRIRELEEELSRLRNQIKEPKSEQVELSLLDLYNLMQEFIEAVPIDRRNVSKLMLKRMVDNLID